MPVETGHLEEIAASLAALRAGQEEIGRRISSNELVLAQCVQAINGLRGSIAPLTEAVEKLAEAASKDDAEGGKLALTLKGILDELGKQTGHLATVSDGLHGLTEQLPGIMEDTALNAVQLATGGGAGPRPKTGNGQR